MTTSTIAYVDNPSTLLAVDFPANRIRKSSKSSSSGVDGHSSPHQVEDDDTSEDSEATHETHPDTSCNTPIDEMSAENKVYNHHGLDRGGEKQDVEFCAREPLVVASTATDKNISPQKAVLEEQSLKTNSSRSLEGALGLLIDSSKSLGSEISKSFRRITSAVDLSALKQGEDSTKKDVADERGGYAKVLDGEDAEINDGIKRFKSEKDVYVMGWGEESGSFSEDELSLNDPERNGNVENSKEEPIIEDVPLYEEFPERWVNEGIEAQDQHLVPATQTAVPEVKIEEEFDPRRPWRKAPVVEIVTTDSADESINANSMQLDDETKSVDNMSKSMNFSELFLSQAFASGNLDSFGASQNAHNPIMMSQLSMGSNDDIQSSSDVSEIVAAQAALSQSEAALAEVKRVGVGMNSMLFNTSMGFNTRDSINWNSQNSMWNASFQKREEPFAPGPPLTPPYTPPREMAPPKLASQDEEIPLTKPVRSNSSEMRPLRKKSFVYEEIPTSDTIVSPGKNHSNSVGKGNAINTSSSYSLHKQKSNLEAPVSPQNYRNPDPIHNKEQGNSTNSVVYDADIKPIQDSSNKNNDGHYAKRDQDERDDFMIAAASGGLGSTTAIDELRHRQSFEESPRDSMNSHRSLPTVDEKRALKCTDDDSTNDYDGDHDYHDSDEESQAQKPMDRGEERRKMTELLISMRDLSSGDNEQLDSNRTLRSSNAGKLKSTVSMSSGMSGTGSGRSLVDRAFAGVEEDGFRHRSAFERRCPKIWRYRKGLLAAFIASILVLTGGIVAMIFLKKNESKDTENRNTTTVIIPSKISNAPSLAPIIQNTLLPTPAASYETVETQIPISSSIEKSEAPSGYQKIYSESLSPTNGPTYYPTSNPSIYPTLTPPDPDFHYEGIETITGDEENAYTGSSLSFSGDGSYLAIGFSGGTGDEINSGVVRIYGRNGDSIYQIGDDIPGNESGDKFGSAIGLSADGQRAVIGARGVGDDFFGEKVGEVKVFEYHRTELKWKQLGSSLMGEEARDNTGHAVAISGDGTRIAVGSVNGGIKRGENTGCVKIYEFATYISSWIQIGDTIVGSEEGVLAGYSVSLSYDGNHVAVGVLHSMSRSGHVQVHQLTLIDDSYRWTRQGNIIPGESPKDQTGVSVSLSRNGNRVAFGANGKDVDDLTNAGYCRVFEYSPDELDWIQVGLDIYGRTSSEQSGWSVSLSGNGKRVACGGKNSSLNGDKSGVARVFDISNGNWTQVGQDLLMPAGSSFGYSVSLTRDGGFLAVGGPELAVVDKTNAGIVRIYRGRES